MSTITLGLSTHPLPTHRTLAPLEGSPPTSNILACAHWKAEPASQGISPISCPSNVLVSCHLKADKLDKSCPNPKTLCSGWSWQKAAATSPSPSGSFCHTSRSHSCQRDDKAAPQLSCPVLQACPAHGAGAVQVSHD